MGRLSLQGRQAVFDVAVLGRTVWDDWQLPIRDLRPDNMDFYGGPGANVAVHLANLGLRCTLVTALGSDRTARLYEDYLTSLGVDLTFAVRAEEPQARCLITPQKKYTFIGDNVGFPDISPDNVEAAVTYSRAVFCAEITGGLAPSKIQGPAYCSPQLSIFLENTNFDFEADYGWTAVFLNKKEANTLARRVGFSCYRYLAGHSGTKWITTNEALPTRVQTKGRCSFYAVPRADVRISIGGGDAFAAGYCFADLMGLGERSAIELGHALATNVITNVGCQLSTENVRQIASGLGSMSTNRNGRLWSHDGKY